MKRPQPSRAARAVREHCTLLGASAGLLVASFILPARAQTSEETHFTYRAPPGCGSSADFRARVARRSARVQLVEAPAPRRLEVEIQVSGAALVGMVTVIESDGATRRRRLRAATCAEAVDGLALIATVSLDPAAIGAVRDSADTTAPGPSTGGGGGTPSTAGAGGGDPRPTPPTSSPPSGSGGDAPSSSAAPAPKPNANAKPASARPASARPASAKPKPSRPDNPLAVEYPDGDALSPAEADEPPAPGGPSHLRASIAALAGARLNVLPRALLGGAIGIGVGVNEGRFFSPFVRLEVSHAQLRGVKEAVGSANFAATLGTLDLCALWLGTRALGLRPCAGFSAGLLRVWGSNTRAAQQHDRAYLGLGPALLGQLNLGKTFEIVADVHMPAALLRHRFAFDQRAFFTTPTLGISTGLGLAGGFP